MSYRVRQALFLSGIVGVVMIVSAVLKARSRRRTVTTFLRALSNRPEDFPGEQ